MSFKKHYFEREIVNSTTTLAHIHTHEFIIRINKIDDKIVCEWMGERKKTTLQYIHKGSWIRTIVNIYECENIDDEQTKTERKITIG